VYARIRKSDTASSTHAANEANKMHRGRRAIREPKASQIANQTDETPITEAVAMTRVEPVKCGHVQNNTNVTTDKAAFSNMGR
jgi:hypothetical protein